MQSGGAKISFKEAELQYVASSWSSPDFSSMLNLKKFHIINKQMKQPRGSIHLLHKSSPKDEPVPLEPPTRHSGAEHFTFKALQSTLYSKRLT